MSKGITSFRALAFIAVFLFHIHRLRAGYLGVQAFFVLSGFLLIPILIEMKASLSKKDFFLNFYGRRALRIFPLYYAYLLAVAVMSFFIDIHKDIPQIDRFWEQLPWGLTYTYDFYHASDHFQPTPLLTHFWSLAVEEQFYILFPLAVFFIPAKQFRGFLLSLVLIGPLVRLLLFVIITQHVFPVLDERVDLVVYVLPFSHLSAFAMGGFFALYRKSRKVSSLLLVIVITLVVGVITDLAFDDNFRFIDVGYAPFMSDSYKFIWGYSVVNLLFAYMLIYVRDRKFLPALFENPLLHYLGKISYGLYVFHFPALWVVNTIMSGYPMLFRAPVALLITIILSAISYELMEKHFIRLKDRYFARTTVTAKSNT